MSQQAYANQEIPYWLARTGVESVSFIKQATAPTAWPNQGSLYELGDGNLYYNGAPLATGGTLSTLFNEGAGTGLIFDTVFGNTANIRTLQADPANAGIVVTTSGQEINIGNTLGGANLGLGAGVFAGKSGGSLTFRSIVGGAGITVTQGVNDVTIVNSAGAVNALANEGAGTGLIFDTVSGSTALLRTLLVDVASPGISIATSGTEVVIGNTVNGANVGAGTGTVFSMKSGATLEFNSLAGTTNGLIVGPPVGGTITLDNNLTGGNVGGGAGVFRDKTGAALNFRSIVAAGGITVTQNTNDITIGSTAPTILALANEGGGAGVFDAVVGTTANLRSLVGTANGLTVTQGATTITVDNTLTGANLGAGAQVFSAKSGASLNYRSLLAAGGSGLTITQNANDITIGATAPTILALANEGGGAGVFDAVVGTTANLRSLVGTANGLTVTQGATTITVDNTLTGTNLGAGAGTVFSAKSGANLQFNSLAGTANGLTVSAPGAGVITIDNTLTGANLGAGAQVFSAKSGASLNFRSILAATGSGLTVTQNTNDITLSRAVAVWRAVDSKTSGTNGGASAAGGTQTRTLNNLTSSGLSSASITLAANQLTVAAGLYYVWGSAPAVSTLLAGQRHAAYLYDVTGAATAIRGTSETTGLLANQSSFSAFSGFIAPAGSTVYEIRQFTQVGTANGLGLAISEPGVNETYTTISLVRLA